MSNSMQHPTWCERPAGHEWDLWGGVDLEQRFHTLLVGEVEGGSINVSIETLESSTNGGPSVFTPVVITVDSRPGDVELAAGQARQLAALLVRAADRVEAL